MIRRNSTNKEELDKCENCGYIGYGQVIEGLGSNQKEWICRKCGTPKIMKFF